MTMLDISGKACYYTCMTEIDYLMTPAEVAKYLGVTNTTVSRHMNDIVNPLPSIRVSNRVVRVRKSSLEKWLNSLIGTAKFIKNKHE